MRVIAAFLLFAATGLAQFPAAVSTDADLKVAADNVQTRLAVELSATGTVMVVTDVSRLAPNMLLTIDPQQLLPEIVSITSISGNALTVTRGFNSSPITSHQRGKLVYGNVTAYHHNRVVQDLEAIERLIGPNATNLPIGGVVTVPSDYNFTPQFPATPLVAAVTNVITLAPCPKGVSGVDRGHWLYFSGGGPADSAELITGGTCTSNATSGTIIFTSTAARSTGYGVISASQGIQEAANALGPTGGTVNLAAIPYVLKALVSADKFRTFAGVGMATKIIPASCSATVFNLLSQPEPIIVGYPVYNTANMQFRDFMIDGIGCPGQNTQIGIAALAGSDTTSGTLYMGIRVTGVVFQNVGEAAHLERVRDVIFSDVHAYSNTRFTVTDTAGGKAAGQLAGFEVHFEKFTYRSGCFLSSACPASVQTAPVILLENTEIGSINRAYFETQGANIASTIGVRVTGFSEDFKASNVTSNSVGIMFDFGGSAYLGGTFYPGHIQLINNAIDAIPISALRFQDGIGGGDFQQVHNVQLTNNAFSNMYFYLGASQFGGFDYVYLGRFSANFSFVNNEWFSMRNLEVGLHVAPGVTGLTVDGNLFANTFTYISSSTTGTGIKIDAGAGNFAIVHNNFPNVAAGLQIVDNSGPSPEKNISDNMPRFLIPSATPLWQHVQVTKTAGNWVSTEVLTTPIPAAATTTQTVYVHIPPTASASVFITNARVKTLTACTGVTTLTATLGSLFNSVFYISTPYDLKAAPSMSNFSPQNGVLVGQGSGVANDDVALYLTSTGGNMNSVADGCTVDVWLLSASLPN